MARPTRCRTMSLCGVVALAWLAAPPLLAAALTLEVDAGAADRVETPVCVEITLPADLAEVPAAELVAELQGPDGKVPGQLVPAAEKGKATVCWIVGSLEAGQKAAYKATVSRGKPDAKGFVFQDQPGQFLDLLFDGRKVTRLMYARDASTKEKHFLTYKPFTHVFDSKGERVITNDHGQPFPHHRGIFIGWRVKLGDGKLAYNFWEMAGGICQRVEKFTEQDAGPVLGRLRALIRWEDPKGQPVILEEREITVYRRSQPELLLDFVSTLRSQAGDLLLDGDPEHGGCQFRASDEVRTSFKLPEAPVVERGKDVEFVSRGEVVRVPKETYRKDPAYKALNEEFKKKALEQIKAEGKDTRYLLPPGMKEGTKGTLDMPWATVSFALGDSRFNVAHLNHPTNPKGTIYSANRDYGRFGAFPRTPLEADQPLVLRYRFFVREAPTPLAADEAQRLYADFASPPQVTVKP